VILFYFVRKRPGLGIERVFGTSCPLLQGEVFADNNISPACPWNERGEKLFYYGIILIFLHNCMTENQFIILLFPAF